MGKTVLLIDGDQYLYRACAACESETRWDEENHVLSSNELEAWDTVQLSLKKVFDHFGTKDHVMAFGQGENFRKQIDPSYKANRAGTRKPMCFASVKERMHEAYNVVAFEGLEADDVMGILSTKPGPTDRIIVARDKDMKTIPGKLWDGMKFMRVSEEDADYFHLYQTLIGDSADGFKGCPGIGPKKAERILHDATYCNWFGTATCKCGADHGCIKPDRWTMARWIAVEMAYEKAGLTADDALRQARLARILRWSDWDSVNKKPILWTPTK